MKIAASFLTMKDDRLNELMNSSADLIHVDVMDGEFVLEKTRPDNEIINMLTNSSKPLDIHLMVKDVKSYIDLYSKLNPLNITFHIEALKDPIEMINYLKEKNIKVGLAINPGTAIESILSYLDMIDVVLVMSVYPGRGGQKFIEDTITKINRLNEIKKINNLDFAIEVDGGINDQTIKKVINVTTAVSGYFITSSDDFEKQIKILKDL